MQLQKNVLFLHLTVSFVDHYSVADSLIGTIKPSVIDAAVILQWFCFKFKYQKHSCSEL